MVVGQIGVIAVAGRRRVFEVTEICGVEISAADEGEFRIGDRDFSVLEALLAFPAAKFGLVERFILSAGGADVLDELV